MDYRKGLSQQMETLAAQRAEIVKQMRRKDAPSELADRRAMLTCKIAKLRNDDKIAEGAIKRIQRTRESNRIDRENRMPLHPRRMALYMERSCDVYAVYLRWIAPEDIHVYSIDEAFMPTKCAGHLGGSHG